MIKTLKLYQGENFDPYWNLAVEQHLLETVEPGCCILYLWQNQNTVVIGRNQNAWKECRTSLLEAEGGRLARRLSGGGAVFHDLGNLNFTFLVQAADYDLERQLSVILHACRSLGIQAERSGRNDVLAEGKKFSGNAFYKNGRNAYHHGTLLVDVDMARLGRYLNPSKAKLDAKGVQSVRSRVINLCELVPKLTISQLGERLSVAFKEVYRLPLQQITTDDLDGQAIQAFYQRNQSWEWNYGYRLPLNFTCEGQFGWGGIQLELQVESGVVKQVKAYSDSMDWEMIPKLEKAITGCRFTLEDLKKRVMGCQLDIGRDICEMLAQQDI